jgi:hypothetical protein
MVVMMAGEKPKEKHAMKYGFVLPLSGIEGALEQLVEYAHIAEEEGWGGAFLEDYIIFWGALRSLAHAGRLGAAHEAGESGDNGDTLPFLSGVGYFPPI